MKKGLILFFSLFMMVGCVQFDPQSWILSDFARKIINQKEKTSGVTFLDENGKALKETPSVYYLSTGGDQKINFNAGAGWAAAITPVEPATDATWLSISPESGKAGKYAMTVTAKANETYDSRSAVITIKCGSDLYVINVVQGQKDAIIVAETAVKVTSDAQSVILHAQTNVELDVNVPAGVNWITPVSTRGLVSKEVELFINENKTSLIREATVTIRNLESGISQEVRITQDTDCPCFTALEPGAKVSIERCGDAPVISMLYSTDGATWNEYIIGQTGNITLANTGDKVYFKANGDFNSWDRTGFCYNYFTTPGGKVELSGNAMFLLNGENPGTELTETNALASIFYGCENLVSIKNFKLTAKTLSPYCYNCMFLNCSALKEAMPELPVMTLPEGCYSDMFDGCTSLEKAPELPAMTLAGYCYDCMFYGCASLTTAPELPAMTLTDYCYDCMFYGCTSLTTAPELPAMTLAEGCYDYMFYGCASLTTAPELPATTMEWACYDHMFDRCTSLTAAPELPAKELAAYCYCSMFEGCTRLTTAPALPATTLACDCYDDMFNGCSSLTTAPELPAKELADECYYGMFKGCTGLTAAPELPATTLANDCYNSMFYGCTNLTAAPDLPATTLENSCYRYMFFGCTQLVIAPMLPAKELKDQCYYGIFADCGALSKVIMLAEFDDNDSDAEDCLQYWLGTTKSGEDFRAGRNVRQGKPTVYVADGMKQAVENATKTYNNLWQYLEGTENYGTGETKYWIVTEQL